MSLERLNNDQEISIFKEHPSKTAFIAINAALTILTISVSALLLLQSEKIFHSIGIIPHNISLHASAGFYVGAGILAAAEWAIIGNLCHHYKKKGVYPAEEPKTEEIVDGLSEVVLNNKAEVLNNVEVLNNKVIAPSIKTSSSLSDGLQFVKRFIAAPATVGSLFPSSSALAKAITKKILMPSSNEPAHRYLEIGPGTGVFTEEIIKKLRPQDHLDVVEFDAEFCNNLKQKYGHLTNVTIVEGDILNHTAEPYDMVVSGLPLNAFSADFVKKALAKYKELTKPEGYISYFEYIAISNIRNKLQVGESHKNLKEVLSLKENFVKEFGKETDPVYRNFPFARVLHCQMPPASNESIIKSEEIEI